MPRDPPVTSATRPSSSGPGRTPLECANVSRAPDGYRFDRWIDALDQAGEHRSRSDFHEPGHAVGDQPLHGLGEAHRRGELDEQELSTTIRSLELARHGRHELR